MTAFQLSKITKKIWQRKRVFYICYSVNDFLYFLNKKMLNKFLTKNKQSVSAIYKMVRNELWISGDFAGWRVSDVELFDR